MNPRSRTGLNLDGDGDAEVTPRLPATVPARAAGEAGDIDLMRSIQAGDSEALSQLYDRYSGILKALILRVIHNEAVPNDLLQESIMEIWNHAKNFSAQKGKPLRWIVNLVV